MSMVVVNPETGDLGVLGFPSGIIFLWAGEPGDVPTGWALCDGRNETPDLRGRFIVGAGQDYAPHDTGGSASITLDITELPAHTHASTLPKDDLSWGTDGKVGLWGPGSFGFQSKPTGGGVAHENRPPFYALSYIMRTP